MARRKKVQGWKLNRTELVQTRIDPRLRFAAELIARQQRRTLSTLIEGLIDDASKSEKLTMFAHAAGGYQSISVNEAISHLWDPNESVRFVALALNMPNLLTHEEQGIWYLIQSAPYFWAHYPIQVEDEKGAVTREEWWPVLRLKGLIREHLSHYWEILTSGNCSLNDLPNEIGKKITKPEDMPNIKRVLKAAPLKNQLGWVDSELVIIEKVEEKANVT